MAEIYDKCGHLIGMCCGRAKCDIIDKEVLRWGTSHCVLPAHKECEKLKLIKP